MREAVARTMIAALATPIFRVTAELRIGPLLGVAKRANISGNVLVARAVALAIKQHPIFNAVYRPKGIAQRARVDIGIAVDMSEGLITPVLRAVGERSAAALTEEWRGLVEMAMARRLPAANYRGATFYLSDLGVFPVVHAFDAIIPAGASALLSVAAIRNETALCTLNCDHRVVFGADAARFLQTLETIIANPETLAG